MRPRTATAALAIALTCAGLVRCSFYDRSMLLSASGDASGDEADGGREDAMPPDTCAHALPPERPASPDVGGGAPLSIVLAVRSLGYSPPPGTPPLGFDLDAVCTCQEGHGSTCAPRGDAGVVCDGPGGRDNALSALLTSLGRTAPGFSDLSASNDLEQGIRGLLLEVREWNGQPDDPSVVLAAYGSNGTAITEAGAHATPRWEGTDPWTVTPDSLVGGDFIGGVAVPVHVDVAAYVRGGVLVGRPVTDKALPGFVGVPLELTGVVLTGRLGRGPTGAYTLTEGQFAGRASTRSLLTGLATVESPIDRTRYLCGTDAVYQTLKSQICELGDVRVGLAPSDPDAPCDAISTGFAITAGEARLGAVQALPPPPAGCGAGYTDDCGP